MPCARGARRRAVRSSTSPHRIPTRAGFEYPADLLAPLADRRGAALRPASRSVDSTRARPWPPTTRARASRVAAGPHRADREHQRGVLAAVQAALRRRRRGAGAAAELSAVRASDAPRRGRRAIPYDLEYHGAWSIDLPSVERAIDRAHARGAARVSPNNPTGSFVARDELDGSRRCARARHRDHRRRGVRRLRAGAGRPAAAGSAVDARRRPDVRARRTVEVGRAAAGEARMDRGGWPDALAAAAIERLELVCDTYLSVSTPVQVAAA